MPFIEVKMFEGRTPEQKEQLILEITRVFEEVLGLRKDQVWILIHDEPKENWGLRGEQASKSK